jgi:tRNA dimethylallyltransferase
VEKINTEATTAFFTDFAAPKTLLVLLGPTGVGKTDYSLQLAKEYGCPIVSSDSRQIYRELNIGVAKPTPEQLAAAPHYFIGTRSVTEDYTAGKYEHDALVLLEELFLQHDTILLVGGSGLYIDAVCFGIDATPAADEEVRQQLLYKFENEGVEGLRAELKVLDPDYYNEVDLKNPSRVLRAVEVCLLTGKPFSQIRQNSVKNRKFEVRFIGLRRDRDVLYERINARVDRMLHDGLLEEVQKLLIYRNLNALKTVGYRELFDYFDGKRSLEEAVALIKRNSRRYAKRQLSWFGRYEGVEWVNVENV